MSAIITAALVATTATAIAHTLLAWDSANDGWHPIPLIEVVVSPFIVGFAVSAIAYFGCVKIEPIAHARRATLEKLFPAATAQREATAPISIQGTDSDEAHETEVEALIKLDKEPEIVDLTGTDDAPPLAAPEPTITPPAYLHQYVLNPPPTYNPAPFHFAEPEVHASGWADDNIGTGPFQMVANMLQNEATDAFYLAQYHAGLNQIVVGDFA
jgi:hypothetical protein